jgi:regulator of sigma E protease
MSWYFYLVAIPIFIVIVLVHEFGHFITAKWAGIRVEEFAIGFPPRALGIRRGETTYSINWFPLGGYVRMTGENGELTDAAGQKDPRSFAAKSAGKRLIVLLAGVAMNFLLAVTLFATIDALGRPDFQPIIQTIAPGSPAVHAGLRPGDRVLSVNGQPVRYWSDFVSDVSLATLAAPAGARTVPIVLVLEHAGSSQAITTTVNARVHVGPNEGHVGVTPDSHHAVINRVPVWQAPLAGLQDTGNVITTTWQALVGIVRGAISPAEAVTGPVGIVSISGQAASEVPQLGLFPVLWLTALLSTSLAVVNVLPIPALDGGRVLLILVEIARRGKRLSPEREGLINLAGMAVLLSLMAIVTYFDISRIAGH